MIGKFNSSESGFQANPLRIAFTTVLVLPEEGVE